MCHAEVWWWRGGRFVTKLAIGDNDTRRSSVTLQHTDHFWILHLLLTYSTTHSTPVLSTHRNSWKHLGWPALRSLRTPFMPRRGLILPRLGLGPLAYMDWCKIYGKSFNKLCFLTFFSNFWPWRSNQRRMCGSWYWISMLALLNMGADCWTGHSEDEAWQQWHGMAWWGKMGTMEWSQWNNAIWCLHYALIDRRARHGKQQSEYWYFWFTLYHHIIMSWLTNFPSNLSLSTVCGDLPART